MESRSLHKSEILFMIRDTLVLSWLMEPHNYLVFTVGSRGFVVGIVSHILLAARRDWGTPKSSVGLLYLPDCLVTRLRQIFSHIAGSDYLY